MYPDCDDCGHMICGELGPARRVLRYETARRYHPECPRVLILCKECRRGGDVEIAYVK